MNRKRWIQLTVILLAAAACRGAYAVLVWTPGFISPAKTMSIMYVRSAYALAAGLGYAQTIPGSDAGRDVNAMVTRAEGGELVTPASGKNVARDGLYPEMLHPPGWSLIAAGLHRGLRLPVRPAMQFLTALVDVSACGLLCWLVWLCLGNVRTALAASALYAVFVPLCAAAANLRPIGFMPFFTILATAMIVMGAKSSGVRRALYYALCGLTIGVASYFRPDFLLLGPFFFLGLCIYHRRFWRSLAAGVAILAVSMAVLLPWARRNHAVCGRWIFTSCGAGCTLITGLGAFQNPWGFGPSDLDRGREAAEQGFKTAFSPEADVYFRKVFFRAVREHPWAYVKIVARRAVQPIAAPYGMGLKLQARTRSFSSLRSQGTITENLGYLIKAFWPRLTMAAVSLVSLVCMIFMVFRERRRRGLIWFMVLVPVYAASSHMFSHMAPYYLLPGVFAQLTGLAYVLTGGWRSAAREKPAQNAKGTVA